MDKLSLTAYAAIIAVVCILAVIVIWFVLSFLKARMRRAQRGFNPVQFQGSGYEEKRQHPRADLWWPVTMETPQGSIRGETKNVSLGGAFIGCEDPLSAGESFDISIELPNHEPVQAKAEVVWTNRNVPADKIVTRGMGVRFIQMSSEDRQIIHQAVEAKLGHKKPTSTPDAQDHPIGENDSDRGIPPASKATDSLQR